jgi:adenosine deaminase
MKHLPMVRDFIERLPKAELHVHVEGTLEPEEMFEMANRNRVDVPFASVEQAKQAYQFTSLQSFLDIYYAATCVLLHEQDFYDLTWAYVEKAHGQNVRHVEMFFDPQAHTQRGVPVGVVLQGIHRALTDAEHHFGMSSKLVLCLLRHLSAEDGMRTLEDALNFRCYFHGLGLDSSERDHPPEHFSAVFARAREEGLFPVAHAGEEGPSDYIWQALDRLHVVRIDHGVRCSDDPKLVERLRAEQIPLTLCPLSNVRLRVFDTMRHHNLKQLLDAGLCVTINSDDPAYFGGYINENYFAVQEAFGLTKQELRKLARHSIQASFLSGERKARFLSEIDET